MDDLKRYTNMGHIALAEATGDEWVRHKDAEARLKSVLDREAATTARYDARIAELEKERDEAREQARMSSFMGEGYAFVEKRAMDAEARADRLSATLKEAEEAVMLARLSLSNAARDYNAQLAETQGEG